MFEAFIGLSREKCSSEEWNWKKEGKMCGAVWGGVGSLEKSDNENT